MPKTAYPLLDLTAHWGRLNDTLNQLVDCIPDDKLDWSPREDLWSFRTILSHVPSTRQHWVAAAGVGGCDLGRVDELHDRLTFLVG